MCMCTFLHPSPILWNLNFQTTRAMMKIGSNLKSWKYGVEILIPKELQKGYSYLSTKRKYGKSPYQWSKEGSNKTFRTRLLRGVEYIYCAGEGVNSKGRSYFGKTIFGYVHYQPFAKMSISSCRCESIIRIFRSRKCIPWNGFEIWLEGKFQCYSFN